MLQVLMTAISILSNTWVCLNALRIRNKSSSGSFSPLFFSVLISKAFKLLE